MQWRVRHITQLQEASLTKPDLPYINAQEVYSWLRVSDPLDQQLKPDAIFILGSGSVLPAITAAGHSMWAAVKWDEKVPICFMSAGGRFGGNIVWGRPEVEEYAAILLEEGVEQGDVYFPKDSARWTTNTLLEAQLALPFIEECLGRPAQHVALCSRGVHQRRAWATFRKQHFWCEYTNVPDDEVLTVELLPRLVQEVDRLREYGVKGDVEVMPIPDGVALVVEQLRTHLGLPVPPAVAGTIHLARRAFGMV